MSCTASVLPALDGCAVNPVKGIASISVISRSAFTSTPSGRVFTNPDFSLVVALTGVKDWVNIKTESVISAGIPDGYKHTVEILNTSVLTYADKKLLDESNDLVFIITNNQGENLIYGAKYGLWKDKQSRDLNANNGQISVSFSSREGIEEPYSDYNVVFS